MGFIDIIFNNINVSLTGTLVNKFSTSSEANIPFLGLRVCRIWLNCTLILWHVY